MRAILYEAYGRMITIFFFWGLTRGAIILHGPEVKKRETINESISESQRTTNITRHPSTTQPLLVQKQETHHTMLLRR